MRFHATDCGRWPSALTHATGRGRTFPGKAFARPSKSLRRSCLHISAPGARRLPQNRAPSFPGARSSPDSGTESAPAVYFKGRTAGAETAARPADRAAGETAAANICALRRRSQKEGGDNLKERSTRQSLPAQAGVSVPQFYEGSNHRKEESLGAHAWHDADRLHFR